MTPRAETRTSNRSNNISKEETTMSNASNLSRRDWFRLRISNPENHLGESARKLKESGFQPIEHPPNHDGMDLSELPPLREAILTPDEVRCLIADIKSHAANIQLMQQRGAVNARASAAKDTTRGNDLNVAKDLFLSGQLRRLQFRYRWQDSFWIDTMVHQDNCIRLVRICHSDGPGT